MKPPKQPLEHIMCFRLSTDERDQLEKAAFRSDKNNSQWIRAAVNFYLRHTADTDKKLATAKP